MTKPIKNIFVLVITLLSFFSSKQANCQQTLTQITGWNAYVHLPASYGTSGSTTYPTIVFFPGIGEVGTNAAAVIANGPGAYIAQGWNGNVTVDGSTTEFIVISLQPSVAYPNEYLINLALQSIKAQYRVNTNKLYLTGLSHGGWCSSTFVSGDPYGGPYTYASQIAAVVTVEGMIPDDNSPYPQLFDNFANSGGRYLGFEQAYDNRDTKTVVDRMNGTKANSAIYVPTNFGSGGHCCWASFYGGQGTTPTNFTLDGVSQNIYQWLARQSKGAASNAAPVVNAGIDQTILLPIALTTLTGIASDADGSIASYAWTKTSGPAAGTISSPTTAITTVTGLAAGVYQFQLKVTDNKGATSTDAVQVTVNAAIVNIAPVVNAGTDQSVTLPTSAVTLKATASDIDGSITAYAWTKLSGPATGTITTGTAAQTTVTGLTAGVYQFQVKVTDNSNATTTDAVQVTVNAAATNAAPVANAGTSQSVTLPTTTVTLSGSGTDSDGSIASWLWTKVSGTGGTIKTPTTASTVITGLTAGVYQFKLTVTDNKGATGASTTTVTVNAIASPPPPVTAKNVRVSVYGGVNPVTDSKWNNWNISTGMSSGTFLYEDKTASTIKASLSGDLLIADNGTGYASTATTTLPAVLRYNSAATSYRSVVLQGLTVGKQYTLEFYASRNNTGNKTKVAVGSLSYTISTDKNINDYAKFTNITPDNTGTVTVYLSSLTTYNYLAGFSVIEQTTTSAQRGSAPQETVSDVVTEETEVKPVAVSAPEAAVYPNPFTSAFKVQLNDPAATTYTIALTDISGKNIFTKKVTKGTGPQLETIQPNSIPAGVYMLRIINADGTKSTHKLIKD